MIDVTNENVIGNISILKLPAKGYREILGKNIPYKFVKRTTNSSKPIPQSILKFFMPKGMLK